MSTFEKARDIVRGTAALPLTCAAIKELQRDGYAPATIARRSDVPVDALAGFLKLADGLVNGDYSIVPTEVRACEQINRALRQDEGDEPAGEPELR